MNLTIYKLSLLFVLFFSYIAFSNENKYIGIFEEWKVHKNSSRPEQIRIDKFNSNIIWFTQPGVAGIGRFDYKNKILKNFKAGYPYRPDGLIIDKKGHLWFGEQSGGAIGEFNPKTEKFIHHAVPYEKANPAIPTIDHEGNIWASDHVNNKIIKFNPKMNEFTIINAPVKNSWVVDLKVDSKNRIWYSAHFTKRIGMIDEHRQTITEYQSPSKAGLAFLSLDSEENIWYSSWTGNQIGYLNPYENKFIEYEFPIGYPQPGAIIVDLINNRIFTSTRKTNAIVMLDTKKDKFFHVFTIPTNNSGQREGIDCDNKGNIWFTEFGKNKIARLQIINYKKNIFSNFNYIKNKSIKKAYRINNYKKIYSIDNSQIERFRIYPKKLK